MPHDLLSNFRHFLARAYRFLKEVRAVTGSSGEATEGNVLSNKGYCICCDKLVTFSSRYDWLRDHYICNNCSSIPRERALMFCIERYYPNWRELHIHESSPVIRGASAKLY